MTSEPAGSGLVTVDGYTHAIRKRLLISTAVCGAGAIIHRTSRTFNPDAEQACPECAAATTPRPMEASPPRGH